MQNAAFRDVGDELDRLCELANVGAGHAATALARLVGRPIRMSVPCVRMGTASADVPPDSERRLDLLRSAGRHGRGTGLAAAAPGAADLVDELVGSDASRRARGVRAA